jgi:hypothetical protein
MQVYKPPLLTSFQSEFEVELEASKNFEASHRKGKKGKKFLKMNVNDNEKRSLEAEEANLDRQIDHLKKRIERTQGHERLALERCLVDLMTRRVAVGSRLEAIDSQEIQNLSMALTMIEKMQRKKK